MVPALRAARQMSRAFSSATLWPLSGRNWPMALSLTETSAWAARPRDGQLGEDVLVGRDRGLGLGGVGGVLAEVVERHPQAVVDERRRSRVTASAVVSPGT